MKGFPTRFGKPFYYASFKLQLAGELQEDAKPFLKKSDRFSLYKQFDKYEFISLPYINFPS